LEIYNNSTNGGLGMGVIISPSILGADLCNLEKDIKELESSGIKAIHIDIMDGNFVPNISFGTDMVKSIRAITNMELDVHLMVINPDMFIEEMVEAGADTITVHAETCPHLFKTICTVKSFGIKAGVAFNPATSPETVKYTGKMLNKVLIMTVEPGFGGQKFIPGMLDKINDLRRYREKNGMDYDIQVDGGINISNFNSVVKAGANDIVIGSSIFNGNGVMQNVNSFHELTLKV
jgi:ribulose-phosphate 3-epimerase